MRIKRLPDGTEIIEGDADEIAEYERKKRKKDEDEDDDDDLTEEKKSNKRLLTEITVTHHHHHYNPPVIPMQPTILPDKFGPIDFTPRIGDPFVQPNIGEWPFGFTICNKTEN